MWKVVAAIFFIILLGVVAAYFLVSSGDSAASFFLAKYNKANEGDITFLVLGRIAEGQGGQWHNAPGLTDAIVIVKYNHETKVVNLISLPRDLYGEFGDEEFKINEMYRREKIEDFMGKLPEITGINVENFLVVDADIIIAVVDKLGGVNIDIEEPITDPVSGFRLEKGIHNLNGEDTIWLMRNRYAPGGDFFREKNQHTVIASIFRSFNALTSVEKSKFLLLMVPHAENAERNFSLGEIAPRFGEVGELTFNSVTLDFSTGLLISSYVPVGTRFADIPTSTLQVTSTIPTPLTSPTTTASLTIPTPPTIPTTIRAYVLLPREGINNYTEIREFIESRLR